MEFVLVYRAPGSRRRLPVDDDGFIVGTGSQENAELRVCPSDLPNRTIVPGKRVELVVLAVPDNLEDVDLAITRRSGELLAIVVQLRVVDVTAVMCVYRLQRGRSHAAVAPCLFSAPT